MLMAHPPSDEELERRSRPEQIRLPSLSGFLPGVGQSDLTLSQLKRSPTSRSDQSDELRRFALPPHGDHLQPRSLHHFPHSHVVGHEYHFLDVHPQEYLYPRSLSEPPQDHRNTKANVASPVYFSAEDASSSQGCVLPHSTSRGLSSNKVVVTEANIEGKGLCYVHDDGSECQKAINGDTVNPNCGTTNVEESRQRFDEAFSIYREEKIRSDPQGPKCSQCQEFGSTECKLKLSSIHSQHSLQKDLASSIGSPGERRHQRTGSSTSTEALTDGTPSRANSRSSINNGRLLSPSCAVDAIHSNGQPPSKKSKILSSPRHDPCSPSDSVAEAKSDTMEGSAKGVLEVTFSCHNDPSLVDDGLTMLYTKEYFKYINSHVYSLFPKKAFLRWVKQCRTKSLNDNMLLYAILAAGTAFSEHTNHEIHHDQFINVAEVSLDRSSGSELQVVQTLLILSMLKYSCGELEKSRALSMAAIRMAYATQLNEEVQVDKPNFELDLANHLECRRRTFWLAFIGVCYQDNRSGTPFPLETLTCNLRPPCQDDLFEANDIIDVPLFQSRSGEWQLPYSPNLGTLAFLAEIALVTHEVWAWLNSNSMEVSPTDYSEAFERMHHATTRKMSAWDKRIRQHYQVREPGMTGMHILYHFVGMLLTRHVRHEHMSWQQIERCCRQAHEHASRLLEIVNQIHEDGGNGFSVSPIGVECPLAGDTIVLAMDIVTAAGTISSLLEHQSQHLSFTELVSGGLETLDTLSKHWKTAEHQLNMVKSRISSIMAHTTYGTSTKVAFFIRGPLHSQCGLEQDVVYGISRARYLQALGYGDKVGSEEDCGEICVQSAT